MFETTFIQNFLRLSFIIIHDKKQILSNRSNSFAFFFFFNLIDQERNNETRLTMKQGFKTFRSEIWSFKYELR